MSARKGSYRPPQSTATAWKPTTALRRQAITSIRSLASEVEHHHPRMGTHHHLKDAANALERGHTEGATRHLTAAIANFAPQSLYRHGMVTDADYHQAKAHMDAVHRHLLLVKDLQDHEMHNENLAAVSREQAQNKAAIARTGREDSSPQAEEDGTEGYGPAANAQRPTARGGNARPMGAPAKLPTGEQDRNVAQPKSVTSWHITKQIAASNGDLTTGYTLELAAGPTLSKAEANYTETGGKPGHRCGQCTMLTGTMPPDFESGRCSLVKGLVDTETGVCDHFELDKSVKMSNVELSAETARLAVTPAPRGKPGGPGLYRVKGMGHTPYLQQVVKALIEKRGMPPGKAYAIARASIRKWGAKSKHPEVRAAAGAAEAGELARQARAHAHSNTGQREILMGWESELRGSHGEWVKALGDLGSKLDSDHPGEGLGSRVREAQSAVQRGDIAGAGQKLQEAKTALRDPKFYRGGRGDATYRHAVGNSYLLESHIKHANAVYGTAQQEAHMLSRTAGNPVDLAFHFNPFEKRDASGKWVTSVTGVGIAMTTVKAHRTSKGTSKALQDRLESMNEGERVRFRNGNHVYHIKKTSDSIIGPEFRIAHVRGPLRGSDGMNPNNLRELRPGASLASEESMTTIDLVGAGGWSHGFKRAGDPGFDPTPHKGGHRSSRASAVKKGDRLMASFEGGRAGFGPHRVLDVQHSSKGGKHRVTMRLMHEGSGKVYKQTVKAHSQVEHVRPGDFNRGQGGRLSPAEHVQRLHDLADKAERSAMLRNQDPNLGGAARPLYGATDDQEGFGSFRRRGGSDTANSLRSAARAIGNGDFERARAHVAAASEASRREFKHGEDSALREQISRHAGTLGSLPRGNSSSRVDTSEKANRAREEAARAYAARSAPARRRVPSGPPQVKAGSSSMGRHNAEDLSGPRLTPVQRTAFGQETRAAAARRTARNRRRNAGLSNWDALDRAIELAVLGPKA